MGVFSKCANCSGTIIGGRREGDLVFCSKPCQDWYHYPGFCEACAASTNEKALGGCFTMNGIGTRIYGLACKGKPCPTCGSKSERKWFTIFFLPVFPVSREFRVKYMTPSRYVSRQVNRPGVTTTATAAVADVSGGRKCPQCGTVFSVDNKTCPICVGRAAAASS